jgi:protein SCO1/2
VTAPTEVGAGSGSGSGSGDAGAGAEGTPVPGSGGGPRIGLVAVLVVLGALFVAVGGALAVRTGDGDGGASSTAAGPAGSDSGSDDGNGDDDGWRGAALGTAQPRPEFTLTDTAGRPYDFAAETRGRLTLLFFGYTSCPDVCPIHMATLAGALDQPGVPEPVVVFVTTDPERDTPEHLRDWLDNFSPGFVGLRGTPEQIRAAEVAAQVPPSMRGTGEGDDYEVGHAAQIIAYTPDDEAHVVYPFGVRREDWIADLPRLPTEWPAR